MRQFLIKVQLEVRDDDQKSSPISATAVFDNEKAMWDHYHKIMRYLDPPNVNRKPYDKPDPKDDPLLGDPLVGRP